jgi:NTP pyrophosphatase (non-canonical NTP hydrolase)
MNLNEASQKALEIAEERGIHENTMNALKHCAGEVLEAVESYTRYVYSPKEEADNFCDELADIVISPQSISASSSQKLSASSFGE